MRNFVNDLSKLAKNLIISLESWAVVEKVESRI